MVWMLYFWLVLILKHYIILKILWGGGAKAPLPTTITRRLCATGQNSDTRINKNDTIVALHCQTKSLSLHRFIEFRLLLLAAVGQTT